MRDEYTSAFYKVVKQTQSRYGYDLPFDIEVYVVMLLSSHVDKKDFLPHDSFAESCLLYTSPSPRDVEESRMPSSA